MNILQLSLLLAIPLKCVIASNGVVAPDVIEALEEDGFGSINTYWWEKWVYRRDLVDHVVTKGVEFIVGFINQVRYAKGRTLAALFLKRSDKVDEVLNKIKYNDDDLTHLTQYRHELAKSHGNFFKVMDEIKDPKNQEQAVENGVLNLFAAENRDSVIPLINALESSALGRNVKDAGIQRAFFEGARGGIKHIVTKFHEHQAITQEQYAKGLFESRKYGSSEVFQFLLDQADQGDLEKAKKDVKYEYYSGFIKAIDDAISNPRPVVPRHERFLNPERVKLAKEAFDQTQKYGSLAQEKGAGDIIFEYLG